MTLQEQAFINWYDNQPTFGVDYQEIWNAACAWQREQDAYICSEASIYCGGQGEPRCPSGSDLAKLILTGK